MAETIRTFTELQAILADNTSGDISPEDARDLMVSTYNGGLLPNAQTVTTTDITGAVGQMYVLTIAGLTANRNLTLPSAAPGQRVGVYVADGDDTYSVILLGAASQTINGGSAATEWSRVFIKGECVIFLCIAANTWIVETDGRKPCSCRVTLSTSVTTNTAATVKAVGFDVETYDVGQIYDHVTNKFMTARRANVYKFDGALYPANGLTDQKYYAGYVYDQPPGSSPTKSRSADARRVSSAVASALATVAFLGEDYLSVGDKAVPVFLSEDADKGVVNTVGAPNLYTPFFSCREQLQ